MNGDALYIGKNAFDLLPQEDKARAEDYAAAYKAFLDAGKTEREAVREAVRLAETRGFRPYDGTGAIAPGDRLYRMIRGKALILAVIGTSPLGVGVNIAAAHVDSPRLDLKQVPLYEDGELALFKTHYYGGIKKYQWVTLPLALHGVVVRTDGTVVDVVIGERDDEPVFAVTDLLPHLAKDQAKKTVSELFTGENLNIIIGSRPEGGEKDTDRFKLSVLRILGEKYGIVEEDFFSAELEAVPAMRARDVGFDRSMIGGYGQDDRSCAFAALRAILELGVPARTAVCVLADKEEVGSDGVSGMRSAAFEGFMADLCDAADTRLRTCFAGSLCLSADVCNAFDPSFPEVSEKRNSAKLNHGMCIMKHTGSGGKSGSSEAGAEAIAYLRRVFAENGVVWQMGELGKVDQGGGGTVAKYMANRGIETVDAGVPVLSMHAPYEIVSKLDCYMVYRGILSVYEDK